MKMQCANILYLKYEIPSNPYAIFEDVYSSYIDFITHGILPSTLYGAFRYYVKETIRK